jgi:hypothetical protein
MEFVQTHCSINLRKYMLFNFIYCYVRFEFLTSANMKITGSWDVTPCDLVVLVEQLPHRVLYHDHGSSKLFRKAGNFLPENMASHRRRQ